MKKLIEFKIAEMERQNRLLEKMMDCFPELNEKESNAIPDEINENNKIVKNQKWA